MFNLGDAVAYVIPGPGQGCVGTIQEVVMMGSFSGEEFGYAMVRITEGNSFNPVGSISSWFLGAIELA